MKFIKNYYRPAARSADGEAAAERPIGAHAPTLNEFNYGNSDSVMILIRLLFPLMHFQEDLSLSN